MLWSRPRRPTPAGVRLRLDPLLEDRCVPCSGHEVMAAAVAPAAVVAPPVAPAQQAAGVVNPTGSVVSVAPPVAATATPTQQPVSEGQSLITETTPSEPDPMLISG